MISYKENRDKILNLYKNSRSVEFSNEIGHILKIKNQKNYYMININLKNAIYFTLKIKKILY